MVSTFQCKISAGKMRNSLTVQLSVVVDSWAELFASSCLSHISLLNNNEKSLYLQAVSKMIIKLYFLFYFGSKCHKVTYPWLGSA